MKHAILFTAWARPDVLRRTLESWDKVRGIQDWSWYFSVEPSVQSDQVVKIIRQFISRNELPFAKLHINQRQLGVLEHPYVGFETLFNTYGFDFVVRAEDDLCVSDDILDYLSWAELTYRERADVATIHAYTDHESQSPNAVEVLPEFNPWIWGTWKRWWKDLIGPTWDHDYSTFNESPGNQCVPVRTEILTPRGWLRHDQIRVGDQTIGYNPTTGRSEWTTIREVVQPFVAPTVSIFGQHKEFECTPEHKWIVETVSHRTGEIRRGLRETKDLKPHSRVLASALAETGPGLNITDQEASLLGWVAGDGSVVQSETGKLKFSVSQKKVEWFDAIDEAFHGLPHSVYDYGDVRTWYLHASAARDLMRRVGHPKADAMTQVLQMSLSQRRAWLQAIDAAEGTDHGAKRRIYQGVGPVSEAIQLAIYLEGWKSSRSAPVEKGGWRPYYAHSYGVSRPQAKTLRDAGEQEVWCVRTDLGTWTARQDDKVMLTGNSGWDWNLNTRIFPLHELKGVYPKMSRVDNIGVHGTHSTPGNWRTAPTFRAEYGVHDYRET